MRREFTRPEVVGRGAEVARLVDVDNREIRANAPLDEIAGLCGFPGKMGMSGAKVWEAYQQGQIKEIRDYCAEELTGYKRPKHVEFRDELPKTNVGKILRRALRDE